MRYIHVEQGTDAWHDLRSRSIGASDVPVLMGESKWGKTPYMLWREKKGLHRPETNEWMLRGVRLEPYARKLAEGLLGPLTPVVVQHESHDWAIASLDGITLDDEPIEIKCPGVKDHARAAAGEVPEHYRGQLQQALWITQADRLHYISYDGVEIVTVEVKPDYEYQQVMFRAEREFSDCLQRETPPPLTEKDYMPIEEDEELARIATARRQYALEKKRIHQQMAELDEQLVKAAAARGRGLKGCGVTVFRRCSSTLDREALASEYGIKDWSRYIKRGDAKWQVR